MEEVECSTATIDSMFDDWVPGLGRRALREFRPPRPVLVDMREVLPGGLGSAGIRERLPLWVRAVGVRFEPVMLGRQLCWVLDTEGVWWAMVEIEARSGNSAASLAATVWTRARQIAVDTPENRRRLGYVDRPPYAVS